MLLLRRRSSRRCGSPATADRALYLADTSLWAWAQRQPRLQNELTERAARGEVLTCVPVALELLHSSRGGDEYEDDLATLLPLEWLPLTAEAGQRALEMQRALAHTTHGAHRLPAVDFLVAAIAESAPQVVLWHVDRDLGRLCDFVRVEHEQELVRSVSGR